VIFERIAAELPGDGVDDALDRQHSLRPAEAAEGGVRYGVGLDPPRIDAVFRQKISVVGMEHGAVDHADADIRRAAAAGVEIEADAADAAVIVVTDAVFDQKVMPISGVSMICIGWMLWGTVMERMAASGNPPTVYTSVNREGGQAFYETSRKQYEDRGY